MVGVYHIPPKLTLLFWLLTPPPQSGGRCPALCHASVSPSPPCCFLPLVFFSHTKWRLLTLLFCNSNKARSAPSSRHAKIC